MKKLPFLTLLLFTSILFFTSCSKEKTDSSSQYKYETVTDDPLNARIYTLANGLKVYLTVYKDAPSIQTYIPVRVGGKNDPSETTGLAHYFEHLMFKGTKQFGTQNYEAEKPLLDRIEELFEVYRNTTDPKERKAIYRQIDSISLEASKFAIPNEYDKLMSAIGSKGTNAYTSEDVTCYVENIPSNQVENWAKIQADRFENAVIRGFHTELETVYEEKNMSLTRDNWKVYETLLAALFPFHPYGTQTVLGTQEHLKNPSITNIKKYYDTYYVANNMAVCMSGDFDPDEVIKIIDKYFGKLRTNPNIPTVKTNTETPIEKPIIKEIYGNDAENITIAWRTPGLKQQESELAEFVDYILNNGKAGLLDLNVIQKQRVLSMYSSYSGMVDHGVFMFNGKPKQGQKLDQVKDVILEQVELLKKGQFEDWLLQATINNFKLEQIRNLENNDKRASMFVEAFETGKEWKDYTGKIERMSKITKKQLVDFANKYFGDNNYTVIYKKTGKDKNEKKIDKPAITPINSNRDVESKFLTEIKNSNVKPIEPAFISYEKDMTVENINKDLPLLYKKNTENATFKMYYVFDMGTKSDKELELSFNYLKFLGTSKYSPEEIKSEFYKMACDFNVGTTEDKVYVTLNGLSENMPKAIELMEELLSDPVVNEAAFTNLIADLHKTRADSKLNQNIIFRKLQQYATWGANSPETFILNNEEIKSLKPENLIAKIKDLKNFKHRIMYYGPAEKNDFIAIINKYHKIPATLKPVIPAHNFTQQISKENVVLFVQYDAKQTYLSMVSNKGDKFDSKRSPIITMYNGYFGGGMNSIVFQEIRETRGLAYSAWANYAIPDRLDESYTFNVFIATQNDKVDDAVKAFDQIINNMPSSDKAFNIAKDAIISNLRTKRITKDAVLWNYIAAEDLGLKEDINKYIYENIQKLTLNDVKKFQEENIKDRKYTYCILGNQKDLDTKKMATYGTLKTLTLNEIFGY